MGLTNERADELVADARDFTAMLAACTAAFADLYQPLWDTQQNDVPVRAAVIALAAQRAILQVIRNDALEKVAAQRAILQVIRNDALEKAAQIADAYASREPDDVGAAIASDIRAILRDTP
jgi:ABC-type transport system involved in cytochrome bd biosynthesis fused ATPase/permease subunit